MRYIFFSLLLFVGCTKQVLDENPLKYSYMPSYLDFDSIGIRTPPEPSTVVDSTFEDFTSIPILGGLVFNGLDTIQAPSGVLISEKKAALFLYYQAEYKRLSTELKYARFYSKEYYKKAKEAEKVYQAEIVKQQKLARRSPLEKNLAYIGCAAGAITTILVQWAVLGISASIN